MQAPDENIFGLQPIVFKGNPQNAENNQQNEFCFCPSQCPHVCCGGWIYRTMTPD
jgi:hypothetical protein